MTRISDDNLTPRVDKAVCDDKADQPTDLADDHVEVAKNFSDPEEPSKPSEAPESSVEQLQPAASPAAEIKLEESTQQMPILK